jgi:hypothetical protein
MMMSEEHKKILTQTTDAAKPSSTITPPPAEPSVELDVLMSTMQKYFSQGTYSCGRCYIDGLNVELLRDKLDTTTLLTCIMKIVFDHERSKPNVSDNRKIELSLIYKSIENLLKILRTDENNVACVDILCKIIGYCMKNYKTYRD